MFTKLPGLRHKVEAEPAARHEVEWQVMNQLDAVFRRLPDDVAAAGVLSSVTSGDPLDIKVEAGLLSRVARSDLEPLRIADADLKARLHAYFKGIRDQLKGAFVEQRPYGQNANVFTEHARASNELRVRLFRMATEDKKRRKSAFTLLGQIEEWRLKHGRPLGEPRHPDLVSGQSWPPKDAP